MRRRSALEADAIDIQGVRTFQEFGGRYGDFLHWQSLQALGWWELGRLDEALGVLDRYGDEGFDVVSDVARLHALCRFAELAADGRHHRAAEQLVAVLEPYGLRRRQNVRCRVDGRPPPRQHVHRATRSPSSERRAGRSDDVILRGRPRRVGTFAVRSVCTELPMRTPGLKLGLSVEVGTPVVAEPVEYHDDGRQHANRR